MPPDERFSLKDHLFNAEKVSYLAGLLVGAIPGFDHSRFEQSVMTRMPDLELKERIAMIAEVLADHLDPDFETAATQIRTALPPPLDPTLTDNDFGDFIMAPFGKFVEDNGIEHYEASMTLLKELTMRFSMESSIRPFINARPDQTLGIFEDWARDGNYHVRRLVSESTRPRLPWSQRIDLDVARPLPLLDILHTDPTRYVTRSVANHLNDISKVDSGLVIDRLTRWRKAESQTRSELDWITTHSLRTLVKKGDAEALRLLGYSPDPSVSVGSISIMNGVVRPGDTLEFSVELTASSDERLLIDYAIEFVKKSGDTSPRVFKLKRFDIDAGQAVTLSKKHRLRANATTYTLYPGDHQVTVIVNGKQMATGTFEVRTD